MLHELALAIALTAALWLIGLPVSALLKRHFGDGRAPFAASAALAPAFGIAITALVSSAAYMFAGPSENWAWPVLMLTVAVAAWSLGALGGGVTWHKNAAFNVAALALTVLIVALCLAAPALGGGFNRVVFNTNPSDTFMYLTLAESTRTASLDQIRSFAQDSATLVSENPLALYSARFVGVFMRLTTFIDIGWLSQLSGLGVERLLWVFAFAMGVATASSAWGVARLLGAQHAAAVLGAIAVTVGFWGAMPREADAYSHLQSVPLLLAIAALRLIDAQRDKPSIPLATSVGILLAAFALVYTELLVLAASALVAEALVRGVIRRNARHAALALGATFAAMIATLLLTGQLAYIVEITIGQYKNIFTGAASGSFVFERETQANAVAVIAGFPWLAAFLGSLGAPAWLSSGLGWVFSLATIAIAAFAGLRTLWKREEQHRIVISAMAAAGVAMAVVALLLRGDVYVFQKAMTSAAPFSLLLIAGLAAWPQTSVLRGRIAAGGAVALIALQLIFPTLALVRDLGGRWPSYAARYHQARNYDLAELHRRLDMVCPCQLLVNVSPEQDWWYAAYVALSLARYNPYYQMGYFYDNGPKTILIQQIPMTVPEYAVVHYSDDRIGPQRLGRLIYDEGQLRLYEVTQQNSDTFAPRAFGAPGRAAE